MRKLTISAEQFTKSILEAGEQLKDGTMLIDLDKPEIVYANKFASSLLQLSHNVSLVDYESLLNRVASENRDYVKHQFQDLLTQKKSSEFEFQMINPQAEDSYIYVCFTNYFLVDSNQLLISVSDISKSKEQESFLVEFSTRKNAMLETMTHHFSGALTLMQHLTKEAEKSVEDADKTQLIQYLRLLSANTASCVTMIDNLLSEEHLKAPLVAAKFSRVEIVDRVKLIYESLIKTFPSRNISFETVASAIYVHTDDFKVLQIINNFISNAIKFTPSEKSISLSIYQTENNVIISVEDEGIGIPKELTPFLFMKKSEAGRPGLMGEQTNGYGMAISKSLAESIQAQIEFETKEGEGSIFYLLLPRKVKRDLF